MTKRPRYRAAAHGPATRPKPAPAARPAVPGSLRRAALVLAVLWAALFAPQLLGRRIFVFGDAGSIRAFAEYSGARWQEHHQRTFWNPYIFAGLPATASLQDSRPQWLPDPLLTAFDAFHRLPIVPPLLIPLLVVLAGAIAMAALARALWGASTLAMTWAGVAWLLMPALLVPFAFGQDWLVMCMALMPLVLLAIERAAGAVDVRARLTAGVALALAVACTFLAAHPQVIALAIPLGLAFALVRTPAPRRAPVAAVIVPAALLGAAMGAAIGWPAQLYNAHSVRGGAGGGVSVGEIAAWSASVPDLIALAWPWAAGFGGAGYWGGLHTTDFPQFVGTTVFVLGLIGLARRGPDRRTAWLLAAAAAAAALLALGVRLGPVQQWLYAHVPLWSSFRVAIRTLVVASLGLALLSARGLDALLAHAAARPRELRRAAIGVAVAGLVVAALLGSVLASTYADIAQAAHPPLDPATALAAAHHAALDLGWRAMVVAALLALFAWPARGSAARWRGPAAIALLAVDLGAVSVPFLVRATGSLASIAHPAQPEIARLAAAEPTARLLDVTRARLFSNDWIRWRAHSFTGNHPAVPRAWDELWHAGVARRVPALQAFAIRWLGGAPAPPTDTVHFAAVPAPPGEGAIWQVRGTLPRAYAVANVVQLPEDAAVVAAVCDSSFDPRRTAFTADPGIAGRYSGAATCRVRWIADDPDHIELAASADSAAFLVIADTWFPGWRATLDGRAIAIHRVQHLVRGLALPAGAHRLRLDYEPEGWAASLVMTRAAWVLWIALALAVGIGASIVRRRAAAVATAASAAD